METRWGIKESGGKKQEPFNDTDPRFGSFEECQAIFDELLNELNSARAICLGIAVTSHSV